MMNHCIIYTHIYTYIQCRSPLRFYISHCCESWVIVIFVSCYVHSTSHYSKTCHTEIGISLHPLELPFFQSRETASVTTKQTSGLKHLQYIPIITTHRTSYFRYHHSSPSQLVSLIAVNPVMRHLSIFHIPHSVVINTLNRFLCPYTYPSWSSTNSERIFFVIVPVQQHRGWSWTGDQHNDNHGWTRRLDSVKSSNSPIITSVHVHITNGLPTPILLYRYMR